MTAQSRARAEAEKFTEGYPATPHGYRQRVRDMACFQQGFLAGARAAAEIAADQECLADCTATDVETAIRRELLEEKE